jgi:hypothetical protein
MFPRDMVCVRNISVDTLHKGDTEDNNNNNIFRVPTKLIRLIKLCPNKTYNTVRVGKHLTDMFPIKNDFTQRDALSRLFFSFALGHAIRRVQVNQDGLKLSGALQLLVYAGDEYIGRKRTCYEEKHTSVSSC